MCSTESGDNSFRACFTKRYIAVRRTIYPDRQSFDQSIHRLSKELNKRQGGSRLNSILQGAWGPGLGRCVYIARVTIDGALLFKDHPDFDIVAEDRTVDLAVPHPYESIKTKSYALTHVSFNGPQDRDFIYHKFARGAGTLIYILDVKVDSEHPQLYGRATTDEREFLTGHYDMISYKEIFPTDNVVAENYNHGTAAGGIAAGRTVGAAQEAKLIGLTCASDRGFVKAKACIADLICALIYAHEDIVKKVGMEGALKAVISMSIEPVCLEEKRDYSDTMKALEMILEEIYAIGTALLVVSAGNLRKYMDANIKTDAYKPACSPFVLTVGAVDRKDTYAKFSNYGPGVDIFAPWVNVMTAKRLGLNVNIPPLSRIDEQTTESGTSFGTYCEAGNDVLYVAAPLVAGIASCILSEKDFYGVASIVQEIKDRARSGATRSLLDISNRRIPNFKPTQLLNMTTKLIARFGTISS
ncbi:subtilisin-like protein [Ascobolus immersus RN42]|uniref:Subtilisin-like protein n=1 Tax=Ascobolus immersus RN42 TaxID=1160509 RepID=A0A3N4IEB0_ASCIM|nr:subtilisin-like protein [Ascobolus immersus RN42]